MENLVSTWSDCKKLPKNYIFPPEKRPGKHVILSSKNIPVIDLGKTGGPDHKVMVQKIVEAAQEFGFLQVINHGVSRKLMDDARRIFKEFFKLPLEEKSELYSKDFHKKCALYTSNVEYEREEIHLWRDVLKLSCPPSEECVEYWPQKPATLRDTAKEYVVEVTDLSSRFLDLICEGLGLELGYFENGLSQDQYMIANHYPACPDPTLTFGAARHCDPSLITILLQDNNPGLQVLKDGQWIGVEPIPDAFVINMGDVIQVVSNGKLKSLEHRVLTNVNEARTSLAYFINPTMNCLVEPAEVLVTAEAPAVYQAVPYEDLWNHFRATYRAKVEPALENFHVEA